MENYKIKVSNETESKEVQNLFLNLGLEGAGDCGGMEWIASDHIAFSGYNSKTMNDFTFVKFKEITLPELRDLVVLKRGLIEDATHVDKEDHRFKYRLINNEWHVITRENPVWRKDSIDLNDAPLFIKPIEKKEMKEYLIKINGAYKLCSLLENDVTDEYIEIPKGSVKAYLNRSRTINFVNADDDYMNGVTHGELVDTHRGRHESSGHQLVWQRESPNDKLASAEQYRQAEVLPFIDDEPDFKKLADLLAETTKHKPTAREWDLSDYDFAESDAWIESNVEQDNVNNPSHYADSAIECIDAMQAMLTPEQFIGYLRGNIFKYQWRYEKKNGVEDLKKSQWYLDKLISAL